MSACLISLAVSFWLSQRSFDGLLLELNLLISFSLDPLGLAFWHPCHSAVPVRDVPVWTGWALGLVHVDLVVGLELQQALTCLVLALLSM